MTKKKSRAARRNRAPNARRPTISQAAREHHNTLLQLLQGSVRLAVREVQPTMELGEIMEALRTHGRANLAMYRAIVWQFPDAPPELQMAVLEQALQERGVPSMTASAAALLQVVTWQPPSFEQRQRVAEELERSVQACVGQVAHPQTDFGEELEIMGWMLRRAREDWSAWEGELKAGLSEDQGAYLHDRMWFLAEQLKLVGPPQ